MPEETSFGVARAREADQDSTKSDLQRRREEARESITQSISDIKDTVASEYSSVKASVTELEWREEVRKHPVAWSLGAVGLGMLIGYGLAGLREREDEPEFNHPHTEPIVDESGGPSAFTDHHSYAAHELASAGGAYSSTDAASPMPDAGTIDRSLASRPSYSSGYQNSPTDVEKAGLVTRFKGTRAYDRLQEEVADLGNRFMDELSNTARFVVLPAIFDKIKEMIGIDLSNKREAGKTGLERQDPTVATRSGSTQPTATAKSRSDIASTAEDIVPSVSGKPAYPRSKSSLGRFDGSASDSPTPSGQTDHSPHINLNYDDRYEQESRLFARGESRGYIAKPTGESKTPASDVPAADCDDAPHGKDFAFEPGRTDNT